MTTDDARDAARLAVENAAAREAGAVDVPEDVRGGEFGRALREAREKAGLSVADVANALKVTEGTVDALEAERHEELPPRPYICGYVQRYARLVGLDAGAVTVGFDTDEAEPVVPALAPRSRWALFTDFARESWGMVYFSIVLVFVILIGGALWWVWPGRNAEEAVFGTEAPPAATRADPTTAVADNPPVPDVDTAAVSTVRVEPDLTPAVSGPPQPAAVDPPVPEAGLPEPGIVDSNPGPDVAATGGDGLAKLDVIAFVFEGECWVEIRDRDDVLVHGDLGRDGDTVSVSGRAPFSVLVGNAAVVDVSFNGKPVAVDSAASGEVARLVVGG